MHLTYSNITSTVALFVALGGTSYAVARNSVGERELKPDAVTSAKVKDGTLQARDLAAGAISVSTRGPRGPVGPSGTDGAPGTNGAPGAPASIEGWRPLEFGVGWGQHPSPDHPPAAFRKDSNGTVYLRGIVTRTAGAPSQGAVIGTLPVGYRSPYRQIVTTLTGEGSAVGRLDIQTNGQIVWLIGAVGEVDYTSLNGVSFATGP